MRPWCNYSGFWAFTQRIWPVLTPEASIWRDRVSVWERKFGDDLQNVVVNPGKLKEVTGEERVSGVVLTDGTEIALSGVFVLRNAVAPGTLLRGLEIEGSDIVVDRNMATNKPGCFAAGDCTGRPYQLAKAVGEGNVAAHSIVGYLAALEK